MASHFNPRTPYGVRLPVCNFRTAVSGFQSTHPVWGATRWCPVSGCHGGNFNPRTPYGVRLNNIIGKMSQKTFQSTHPVWGATRPLYARSACRGISIHAPRMGCDDVSDDFVADIAPFQSTHPVWGATCKRAYYFRYVEISIHAPRMGCDDGELCLALR